MGIKGGGRGEALDPAAPPGTPQGRGNYQSRRAPVGAGVGARALAVGWTRGCLGCGDGLCRRWQIRPSM